MVYEGPLSAMHQNESTYNLLCRTYGADPDIRDYSGRKASYYMPTVFESQEDQVDNQVNRRSDQILRDFLRESTRKKRPRANQNEIQLVS